MFQSPQSTRQPIPSRSPKLIGVLFFALAGLEGLATALWLSLGASGGTQISLVGRYTLRLVLVSGVAAISLVCLFFALREWRLPAGKKPSIERLADHPALLAALWIGFLALAAACLAVLVLSPGGKLGAYLVRWRPVTVWLCLLGLQFCLLAAIALNAAYWKNAFQALRNRLQLGTWQKRLDTPAVGAALLILALLIGLGQVSYGRFVDEADNLTTGWLISRGEQLYSDVFSHHFPFPYYWVAGVVRIFGPSQAIIRISLYMLQALVLGLSMRLTRFYLPIGLTALCWAATRLFHRANLVIYDAFAATFILAGFLVVFSSLVRKEKPGLGALVFVGVTWALAMLSDPLMAYPAGIMLAALFVSGVLFSSSGRYREGLRRLLTAGLAAAVVLGLYGLYLLATGTLDDFYADAVQFNVQVYGRYMDESTNRLPEFARQTATGLNILNPEWRVDYSPFRSLNTYAYGFEDEAGYFSWIFSSFFFRLAILACVLGLILQRTYVAGLFLYLLAASLLLRFESEFHSLSFIFLSQFAAVYSLGWIRPRWTKADQPDTNLKAIPLWQKISNWAWSGVKIVVGAMLIWSVARGLFFSIDRRTASFDMKYVRRYALFGEKVRQIACNRSDVTLVYYPIDPLVHFITQIPPTSKYIYLLPWVAEVGMQELIQELSQNPAAVVYVNTGRKHWQGYKVGEYYPELISFLDRQYVKLGDNLWASPALDPACRSFLEAPAD